ncbi:MAG: DUF4864 domain-containing protein [Alkalilacustris sp.]
MRPLLVACLLLLQAVWAGPAVAGEIRDTIQRQIDAFMADDLEAAFAVASPGIKQMFRTPQRFAEMVRSGYPMVWRPQEVRFLDRRAHPGDGQVQRVMIRDADGRLHLLDYLMIPGPDGWQIAGVQILRGQTLSAAPYAVGRSSAVIA